jgi:hypothetical protein
VYYFLSKNPEEALFIALLFAISYAGLFLLNSIKSVKEYGGIIFFLKKALLNMKPAFTIKQKANKKACLIEHCKLISDRVNLQKANLFKRNFKYLKKSTRKRMQKFCRYSCFGINAEDDTIKLSVSNPYPVTKKDPFTVSISVQVDYPYSTSPSFRLETISDWNKGSSSHRSPIPFDARYKDFDKLSSLMKHTKKLLRDKITQYETQIRLIKRA